MNPRQIAAFRAVAQVGTVTGAAERLNISQPAVSRLIAHLEDQARLSLFARDRGRLTLTPEGEAFLRAVDRHFSGLEALEAAAERIARHGPENLRIVGFPSFTGGVLPKAVARYLARHPDARITLETDTTDRIAPQVAAGRFDLGFLAGDGGGAAGVDAAVIASRPWNCVIAKGHPLAANRTVAVEDLADEPLVAFSPGMSLRQSVDHLFRSAGVMPDYRVEAQTIESICALVAEGCGAAIIHPYATSIARIYGLEARILAAPAGLDLAAVSQPAPHRPRVVAEIIEDVRAILEEEQG